MYWKLEISNGIIPAENETTGTFIIKAESIEKAFEILKNQTHNLGALDSFEDVTQTLGTGAKSYCDNELFGGAVLTGYCWEPLYKSIIIKKEKEKEEEAILI